MTDINQEIDQLAEAMTKSNPSPIDAVKAQILELGPEGLKKAVSTMGDSDKELLKSVLDEMAKSSKQKVIETTPDGEQDENEKKGFDKADEAIASSSESTHSNQGDTSPEGFDGQIIKGCDMAMEKVGIDSKGDLKDAAAGKDMDEPAPKAKKKELKKMKKSEFSAVLIRMQERKLEKSACIAKLAEATELASDKISAIWDEMEKSSSYKYDDGSTGKDVPESDQVKPQKELANDKKPKQTNEIDRGGDSKCCADEGEKPPMTKSLEKGGEGSKGGKVIGHTKSGKPIYDDHGHADHASFTKQDHGDAARLNNKLSDEADVRAGIGGSPEGDKHYVAAEGHKAASKAKSKKPAMSHFDDHSVDDHFDAAQKHEGTPLGDFHHHMRVAKQYDHDSKSVGFSARGKDGMKRVRDSRAEHKGKAKEALKQHNAAGQVKKSNVDENFTLAKARNPFTERNIDQTRHYNVDALIAAEYVESFKKSNFDYSASEGPAGINELLEKGLDMDGSVLSQAIALKAREESGVCFVKSFSDEDLTSVQERSNLWSEEKEDSKGE